MKYTIFYHKQKIYDPPVILDTDVDKISIKILRGTNFLNCANPIIKFRLSGMESCSGPSIYGGQNPTWAKECAVFPLRTLDFERDRLTVEVVDKDWLTGEESLVASCVDTPIDIRKWIGNKSFEGSIGMDDGVGNIQVVVKIEFPSFMSGDSSLHQQNEVSSNNLNRYCSDFGGSNSFVFGVWEKFEIIQCINFALYHSFNFALYHSFNNIVCLFFSLFYKV